jgi:hypothetical protein
LGGFGANSQNPESKKRPELVSFIVKAVVLARFQDPEQEESTQPGSPCHDEERDDNVACIVAVLTKSKRDDGEHDEVCAASKIGELVEFQREGYGKEEELVGDCDEEGDGEVVVVENMDGGHGVCFQLLRVSIHDVQVEVRGPRRYKQTGRSR